MSRSAVTLLVALCACAGPRWSLQHPGPLTGPQKALLQQAERRYRAGEDLEAERQQILADEAAAWWWTRMVVRDVVHVREGKAGGEERSSVQGQRADEALVGAIRADRARQGGAVVDPLALKPRRDPVEDRALAELAQLGAAAAPCLCADLASHPQGFIRQIGTDLLAMLGPDAGPAVRAALSASSEPQRRRSAAMAFAAMADTGAVEADLRQLGADPDYAVRAAAMPGLARASAAARAAVRHAVQQDADPFVRRAAAKALAVDPTPASAQALVDFLGRCQQERDAKGCEAAQASLQALARSAGPRSLDAWRRWAEQFAAAEQRPGDG
jgi:HEAT repeat protein